MTGREAPEEVLPVPRAEHDLQGTPGTPCPLPWDRPQSPPAAQEPSSSPAPVLRGKWLLGEGQLVAPSPSWHWGGLGGCEPSGTLPRPTPPGPVRLGQRPSVPISPGGAWHTRKSHQVQGFCPPGPPASHCQPRWGVRTVPSRGALGGCEPPGPAQLPLLASWAGESPGPWHLQLCC